MEESGWGEHAVCGAWSLFHACWLSMNVLKIVTVQKIELLTVPFRKRPGAWLYIVSTQGNQSTSTKNHPVLNINSGEQRSLIPSKQGLLESSQGWREQPQLPAAEKQKAALQREHFRGRAG